MHWIIFNGQWLSIPFILIGLYFVIKAKKIRQTFSYTKALLDLTLFFWHKKNVKLRLLVLIPELLLEALH
jgi:prolipoprotein diacylglyceryltransferase